MPLFLHPYRVNMNNSPHCICIILQILPYFLFYCYIDQYLPCPTKYVRIFVNISTLSHIANYSDNLLRIIHHLTSIHATKCLLILYSYTLQLYTYYHHSSINLPVIPRTCHHSYVLSLLLLSILFVVQLPLHTAKLL